MNDPVRRAKNVVTFATRKANLACWELDWTQCRNVTHGADDGHIPLASLRTLLCTSMFRKVVSECRVLYNEIDFGVLRRQFEDVRQEL